MRLQRDYCPNGGGRVKDSLVLTNCHDFLQSCLWHVALLAHCHQSADRSFFIRSRQVPLCSRCFGILVGMFLIPLYVHDLRIATLLIAAMVLDGGTQALKLRTSNNSLRFATGIGFALGCGGYVARGVHFLCNITAVRFNLAVSSSSSVPCMVYSDFRVSTI